MICSHYHEDHGMSVCDCDEDCPDCPYIPDNDGTEGNFERDYIDHGSRV